MRHPLSDQPFIKFLRRKAEEQESYVYVCSHSCAIAQYLEHVGIKYSRVMGSQWADMDGNVHDLPKLWDFVVQPQDQYKARLSFAYAARRAEEYLGGKKQKVKEKRNVELV